MVQKYTIILNPASILREKSTKYPQYSINNAHFPFASPTKSYIKNYKCDHLLERQQVLYIVSIITREATGNDLSSASGFNDYVSKENVLIHLNAGNGSKADLSFLTANEFRFAVNYHFFLVVDDYLLWKYCVAVA